ncbi:MAG: ketoacyl-ACP synthase III [Selenomonadaceae bacterium]|nr:ketoacyl-ACP synthase III [Selenomonadaceae bacterium]
MFAKIRAVSSYLPEKIEKNSDFVNERFSKKLGVVERHIAADDESAGDLAVRAAENLFSEYDINRDETDFILLCTQHPDYQVPNTAPHLQYRLGLSKNVGSMDIALGCSGYIYGLAVAKGLIETGMAKKILFITSSVYTKYASKKDLGVRPLFGDGATATWIEGVDEESENIRAFVFGSDGSRYNKLYIPVGGSRNMPRNTPEVFEYDENHNGRSNYDAYMDGMAITYFTFREVPPLVDNVLAAAKITRADLDYCIFHQANYFMLEQVRKKTALEDVPFHNDITHTGNLISGSVPYAIEQVIDSVDVKNLHNVLLTGFGVGLSWAGCIVDLSGVLAKKVGTNV